MPLTSPMDKFHRSMQRMKVHLLALSVATATLCFYLSPATFIDDRSKNQRLCAAPLSKEASSTTLISTNFRDTDWVTLKAKRSELNLISFLYGQPQPELLENVSATTSSKGGFEAAAGKISWRPLQIDLEKVILNGTPLFHRMSGSVDQLSIDLDANPFAVQAHGFSGNLDALD